MSSAYAFRGEPAKELLKALGLEGRQVKKIVLTFEAGEAAICEITEYSRSMDLPALTRYLTMVDWKEDVTTATDDNVVLAPI